jgi:UrcA family protein
MVWSLRRHPPAATLEQTMKALILCGALTALAVPAFAAPGDVRPVAGLSRAFETTVRLGDLDLNRLSGAEAALDRIRLAGRKVCGARPSPMDLVATHSHRVCAARAVDSAVAALDAPLVTARHMRGDVARLASR